jgi:hypothetical protein
VPTNERVTVTLPADLVRDIDRLEKNRSKFIQEAARRELERRRRDELARSLRSPHPDATELTEAGFEDWASSLPEEDAAGLVDLQAGTEVRALRGRGRRAGRGTGAVPRSRRRARVAADANARRCRAARLDARILCAPSRERAA